ncbi:MAG: hypothetical protein LBM08_12740 [Dysgonamonadaceae bacterium]|jgi:hypothetical protein|nr:hypothetical protein [Dysgonamonadaceae bacterium]
MTKEIDEVDEIILIQETSSLILGHEQGDREEEEFIKNVVCYIDKKINFYHITNIEKTKSKVKNNIPLIDERKKVLNYLYKKKNFIPFHKSKKKENLAPMLLFKFKNPNRAIEGIILSPTNTINFCIHMGGEMMQNYWDNHLKYFHQSEKISIDEINQKIINQD